MDMHFSIRFQSYHVAPDAMSNLEKLNVTNTTGRKLMHCFCEALHGTGKTKHSNWKTITFRDVITVLYCSP